MERFDSEPLPLSPSIAGGQSSLAQLIFYDVDHSGQSFEAFSFLNNPEARLGPPLREGTGFAGSFVIFGHGGCVGDEGHCKIPEETKDPFDTRPLHGLTPQTKTINITDALKRVCADPAADHGHLQVTVLPMVPRKGGPEPTDVLFFSAMRLVAFD
jgi:hypothetical protein